jgi:hypothetical protein
MRSRFAGHLLQLPSVYDFQLKLPSPLAKIKGEGLDSFLAFHRSIDSPDQAEDLPPVLAHQGRELRRSMRLAIEEASNQIMLKVILQEWSQNDRPLLRPAD